MKTITIILGIIIIVILFSLIFTTYHFDNNKKEGMV